MFAVVFLKRLEAETEKGLMVGGYLDAMLVVLVVVDAERSKVEVDVKREATGGRKRRDATVGGLGGLEGGLYKAGRLVCVLRR